MQNITLTMNPTIDMNSQVDQVLAERKLRCHAPRYEPGGGGINVSRAIKKLGGESIALYLAGGSNGKYLTELLDDEDIENTPIPIQGTTRENIIIREESSDQQFRFGMPGSEIFEQEWQQCLDELEKFIVNADYLIASGSLPGGAPEDFYARVADMGNRHDVRVIIDTTGEPLCSAVETGVFMIKPNIRELEALAGRKIETESQLETVAKQLLAKNQSEVVVVSLGAGGAFLVSEELNEHLRSPTVPIRSKVGAGDSMVAGIVLSLARGKSLIKSVQYGMAAGAAAVMTPGTELCKKEDTEKLFERMIASYQLSL